MSPISKSQLRVVNLSFDKLLVWSLETLETTEWNICHWLRSPYLLECSHNPFKKPQEKATLARYSGYWKQLLLFCLHTALLEREVCDRIYGIEFTAHQRELVMELKGCPSLCLLLTHVIVMAELYDDELELEDEDEFEDDDVEDDESDEESDMAGRPIASSSVPFRGHTDTLIEPLVEKVIEFSISLIVQQFSQGESPHSPLLYFTSVMGIDLKNEGFRRASSYTPIVAGLLWIM